MGELSITTFNEDLVQTGQLEGSFGGCVHSMLYTIAFINRCWSLVHNYQLTRLRHTSWVETNPSQQTGLTELQ